MSPTPKLGFAMDMGNCEITAVKPGGLADRAGLLVGDVIVELDGMAPVAFLASAWWPRDVKPVLVRVERDGRRLWRVLEFDVEAELGCDAACCSDRRR